ncbi:nicotinate-nucleotide adenylyltransferase [Weissella sagaensis]|uniref:Probable nicotinate-nucleotide adenylyltransferase n=1 Tax=Weissella sagaensis TaxID=2559928 RepID=A0ABW1RU28_9LACO|nr:nicotinate-nucleotide adenylyltransferase [Weissella sagaensis]KAA8433260.1 nicotinate-nucleotide adenylyltransferase [Weissella paramesenteroides]MBU7567184.1 nicotinate-nucleotide adenylyltransferase [Weissella hellenica]KAA8439310.1 nicotinate-nucleotide adenylyltransferase [Weissella paramesenteroides]QDJ59239.1 nicotinate-nucleotide adenylyltransferase [Weissella hellenica]QEA56534.1 nicotinate-nucleotide adenylyltransferase [Weissella hellenica]
MVATFQQFVTQLQLEPEVAKNKQKIGILGGTFNPPHIGHLIIAEQVADKLGLDKVYFMPNAKPPHVDFKAAINPIDRARMVQAAIVGNSRFDIEPLEVQRGGKSYTYNTMLQLKLEHPNYEYYFIIGGDEVAYLKTWYRIDDLLKLVKFVGVNRPGQVKESAYPVIWVDVPDLMISSTDIRQRISRHQSVRYLVPDLVAAYIVENGLYLNDR